MKRRVHPNVQAAIDEIERQTKALKKLAELVDMLAIPTSRGGVYVTDWEREFVRGLAMRVGEELTDKQIEKIDQVHDDLRKGRTAPQDRDPGAANLFSNMEPAKRAEQFARAKKVKLPWEK